jgi:hypothetical protein
VKELTGLLKEPLQDYRKALANDPKLQTARDGIQRLGEAP